MTPHSVNDKLLIDVGYHHLYKNRVQYVMHPQRNAIGDGAGMFSIRNSDSTRKQGYVTERELAELFAIDGFIRLGINLRMLPAGKYEGGAPPGLRPSINDVVKKSVFEAAVDREMRRMRRLGLSPGLFAKLVTMGIAVPSQLQPRESTDVPLRTDSAAGSNGQVPRLSLPGSGDRYPTRPNTPADEQAKLATDTSNLKTAEREAVVKVRIGQGDFREILLRLDGEKCWMSGIEGRQLLIASHIKPWSRCEEDTASRGAPDNGLLLSALWDAAFDAGLVTFDSDWKAVASSRLSETARRALNLDDHSALPEKFRTEGRKHYLAYHREKVFEYWNKEPA